MVAQIFTIVDKSVLVLLSLLIFEPRKSLALAYSQAKKMSGKKSRRIPSDLKSVQDERLTCRHIQTLMQLQQATDENEELKNKVQILEKEIMSCQELHKRARDSEKEIKEMKEDFKQTLEVDLGEMKASHTRKYTELLNAKDQLALASQKIQQELKVQIIQLEDKNKELQLRFENQINDKKNTELLEKKLEGMSAQLSLVEEASTKLELELAAKTELEDLHVSDKQKDSAKIALLENRINELSTKLESEISSKKRLIEQSDLLRELEKQRCIIESLQNDKEFYENSSESLNSKMTEYEMKIISLERTKSMLELERDALSQSSDDLRNEVQYLKEREASNRSGDFNDYVNIKRELLSLREENIKLKSSRSRLEIKTLKAEGNKPKKTSARLPPVSRKT